MGRHDDALYQVDYELPDGPHIMSVSTKPDMDYAKQRIAQIVADQHAHAKDDDWKMRVTSIKRVPTKAVIYEAVEALRAKDIPGRMDAATVPQFRYNAEKLMGTLPDVQDIDDSVYWEHGLTPPGVADSERPPRPPGADHDAPFVRGSIGQPAPDRTGRGASPRRAPAIIVDTSAPAKPAVKVEQPK